MVFDRYHSSEKFFDPMENNLGNTSEQDVLFYQEAEKILG